MLRLRSLGTAGWVRTLFLKALPGEADSVELSGADEDGILGVVLIEDGGEAPVLVRLYRGRRTGAKYIKFYMP